MKVVKITDIMLTIATCVNNVELNIRLATHKLRKFMTITLSIGSGEWEVNTAKDNCSYWQKKRRNKHYMGTICNMNSLFLIASPRVVAL